MRSKSQSASTQSNCCMAAELPQWMFSWRRHSSTWAPTEHFPGGRQNIFTYSTTFSRRLVLLCHLRVKSPSPRRRLHCFSTSGVARIARTQTSKSTARANWFLALLPFCAFCLSRDFKSRDWGMDWQSRRTVHKGKKFLAATLAQLGWQIVV